MNIPSPSAEQRIRGFCPASGCNQLIEALSFREPGGDNDGGAIVAQCDACATELTINIVNPADAQLSGASEVRVEGDLRASGLPPSWRDTMFIQLEPADEPVHDATSCNLFRCDACDAPIEESVQRAIAANLQPVNRELRNIHFCYEKSMFPEPAFTVVRGTAQCGCGAHLAYTAFRTFRPNQPHVSEAKDLLIASVEGADGFAEIDGVFTRDECEALVTKLIYRWRLLFPSAVMATPFVGFSNDKKNKQKYCDIWGRLLTLIDPASVTLVTRKRAITEYRQAAELLDEVEFAVLERYGLLHPALTHYVKENHFHAKFYAAVDEANDRVEALIGSFNFQEGPAMENMTLRPYSNAQFRRRYLDKLRVPKDIPKRPLPYCVIVDLDGGQPIARPGRLMDTARPAVAA